MPSYATRVHPALGRLITRCVGYQYRTDPASVHHGLPSTARTLLGMPAGPLSGVMLEQEAAGLISPGLHERLDAAPWAERFRLLQEHLLDLAGRSSSTSIPPELAEAWRVICSTGGRVRIDRLSKHVGWSRRHLSSRFTVEFGLAPKQASMVARFEHAKALAMQGRRLADVAVAAGYADQAHLNRDWRLLAGQTPTETAADFPIVQATTA